jgi:methyl-galactoside transport system ATP-binding protein
MRDHQAVPGVLALDSVDFSVERGTIHSLIGQNGAGNRP